MIELHILSGKKAGATVSVSKFPFQVGRTGSSALTLDEAGFGISISKSPGRQAEKLVLNANSKATTVVNGEKVKEVSLREGDVIEAGAVKMRFGFEAVRQKSLGTREMMTWIGLGALSLGQIALIYQLLR